MYDAIRTIHLARKAADALNRDKAQTARSQTQKTRACTNADIPENMIKVEISNYNACRGALVSLGDEYSNNALPVMTLQDTYRKSTHTRRTVGDSRITNGRMYSTGVTITSQQPLVSMVLRQGDGSGTDLGNTVSTQGLKAQPRMPLFHVLFSIKFANLCTHHRQRQKDIER